MSAALLLAAPAATATAAPTSTTAPTSVSHSLTTLIHQPLNNCELGADAIPGSGTPSPGFVGLVVTPRGQLIAGVVLRDALPGTTYRVFLIQSDGDLVGPPLDCDVQDGTVSTDAAGNGVLVLSEQRLPTARYVHVYLFTQDPFFDYYDTPLIPVA
jgi:hypothetical protein